MGGHAFARAANIATRDGAESLIAATVTALGGVDIFVANAGVWQAGGGPLTGMSDEQWATTIRENVDSVFFTSRAVARVRGDGGRIVLVSRPADQRGEAGHAAYGASEGAGIS